MTKTFEASISTPALLRRCRGCGEAVLGALSEGVEVQADLTVLDEPALVAAAILGRRVLVAARSGVSTRVSLWAMTEWTPLGLPHLVEHVCAPGSRRPDPRSLGAPDPSVAAHLTGWAPSAQLVDAPPY